MFTVGLDTSALDANFKEHASRGIGRYVRELLENLSLQSSSRVSINEFDHRTFAPSSLFDLIPVGRETVKQQIAFPAKLWLQGNATYDCFHFPAHMDAPSWCGVPYILTVLDLIPLVCGDLYRADRPGWRFRLARWLENKAIQNASMLLSISENTKRDVQNILGVPEDRILVTPLGVDKKFFSAKKPDDPAALRSRYGIPQGRQIILYVGGIDQRKNMTTLIQVFAELQQQVRALGKEPPVLVLAGRIKQDRQFPKLQNCIKEFGLETEVVLAGFVPDEDLLQLYTQTTAFCFLSLYEGFGLPVLEAMAAGVPVVASNTSAMPEVMGDTGIAVDPTDVTAACKALLQLCTDPQVGDSLRFAGRRQAALFTWEKTAQLTIAAYEEFAERFAMTKAQRKYA